MRSFLGGDRGLKYFLFENILNLFLFLKDYFSYQHIKKHKNN